MTTAAGLTHSVAAGGKPRLTPDERAVAAFFSIDRASAEAKLSQPIKRALVILLEDGELIQRGHFWRGRSGRALMFQTIEALWQRILISVAIDKSYPRRHIAKLTEIGRHVASSLRHELDTPTGRAAVADDNFEDATLAYGDEQE